MITIDGSEGGEGRGLLCLSALYWCLDWIDRAEVHLIDVTDENVVLAAEVLHWEHGVHVRLHAPGASATVLRGADLYAAIAFRSARHLRLAEARNWGVPTLVALQFPEAAWLDRNAILREREAFDPNAFADALRQMVSPWL